MILFKLGKEQRRKKEKEKEVKELGKGIVWLQFQKFENTIFIIWDYHESPPIFLIELVSYSLLISWTLIQTYWTLFIVLIRERMQPFKYLRKFKFKTVAVIELSESQ